MIDAQDIIRRMRIREAQDRPAESTLILIDCKIHTKPCAYNALVSIVASLCGILRQEAIRAAVDEGIRQNKEGYLK